MKLESMALQGRDVLNLKPVVQGDILDTSGMLGAIWSNLGRVSVADLAYSAHTYVANGLAQLAITKAANEGTKNIGFTGGAACNQLLSERMRRVVEDAGLRFYVHNAVPCGDGGVSFGQAVIAAFSNF